MSISRHTASYLTSVCYLLVLGPCQPNDPASPDEDVPAGKSAFGDSTATAPPYNLSAPAARFGLPLFLKEISGITVLDDATLGAIEDETGTLYRIDMNSGEASKAFVFGPNGDYEDIERVGERLFVLRSDAVVYELVGWRTGRAEAHDLFGDFAERQCDTESLATDGQQLVVVCKKPTAGGGNNAYAIDLAEARFGESPLFEVTTGEGFLKGGLRPSAMAWHPILERWVLISAKLDALVVLSTRGAIEQVWGIESLELEQPEGIAFLPNGDMWLATEGKIGTGGLVRLTYREP